MANQNPEFFVIIHQLIDLNTEVAQYPQTDQHLIKRMPNRNTHSFLYRNSILLLRY